MRQQLHEGACELSYASYCAQKQGKFWQMHDAIFSAQKELRPASRDKIDSLARKAGLSMGSFKGCMNSSSTKDVIAADIKEANDFKIQSTPTVFINGKKINIQMPLVIEMIAEQEGKAKFNKPVACQPE